MRGHIVKQRSRYYAVVCEGADPATQKERHRCYQAGRTRKGPEKILVISSSVITPATAAPPTRSHRATGQ